MKVNVSASAVFTFSFRQRDLDSVDKWAVLIEYITSVCRYSAAGNWKPLTTR